MSTAANQDAHPEKERIEVTSHLRNQWADLFTDPHQTSAQRMHDYLRQFVADIESKRAEALRLTADGLGPRGKVAVRVNSQGVVTEAKVADDAGATLDSAELAHEFVSATREAAARVRVAVDAQLGPIDDFLTEMSQHVSDSEWHDIQQQSRSTASAQRERLFQPEPLTAPSAPAGSQPTARDL